MTEFRGIPGVCSGHARQRVSERYGVTPTPSDWRLAQADILDGRAVRTRCRPDGEAGDEYLVRLGSTAARVIFSPDTSVIVTVVPPAMRCTIPDRERQRQVARKRYWKSLRGNRCIELD